MKNNETKIETKSPDDNGYYVKREKAQKLLFSQIEEILQRNVTKSTNKSYTQYTKDLLRTYVQNPESNQDTLREISRFICRYSMIYKKLLMYYSAMPLYYYNITQLNDLTKTIGSNALKDYQSVLERFEKFNLKKEMYTAAYLALRDGFYVGYMYESEGDGMFLMPLDTQYCRIYGKTIEGEWIVYFNAAYFSSGNNGDYITGIDGAGTWDDVFVDGYNAYQSDRNAQWFRLPPEKTFCLLSCPEDEFTAPLPFFLPLFQSLLDLLDLETILNSKTELENYKLLVSKIPLMENTQDVDDFAISLELAKSFNALLESVVPDLIGVAYSPMDIEPIEFENSNSTDDTDALSQSIQNLFNNAGASQLVVAGGSSTNSVGLKYSLLNDLSTCWVLVDRMQTWLNYYIKMNISDGYKLEIHKISWYNEEEYQTTKKDVLSFGGSVLDYLTACGDTPYTAFQKLNFENAVGIKSLMRPLQTSYTTSSTGTDEGGRPTEDGDDLTEEGIKTRDEDKNQTENQ